jgi:hypothetical protein
MVTLFPLSERSTLSGVLNKLQPDTQPAWGIMDAQQMIEHLDLILQYTFSGEQTSVFTPAEQVEKVKRFLWSDKPLPRLFRNPAMDDVIVQYPDLNTAIQSLYNTLENFHQYYKEHPSYETTHPIFGMLNYEGWLRFHQKHFQHHLTQFGLL